LPRRLAASPDLLASHRIGGGNEIGPGRLSAKLATAVREGAGRSAMGCGAPVLTIPAEPNAAIQAQNEAGSTTSRPNAAIAANRGFMITVSPWGPDCIA